MATFVEVARHRSFSLAAEALGVPTSSVSRHIAQMEARLGVKLLNRTSRQVHLTSTGQDYYQQAIQVIESAQEAYAQVRGEIQQMRGRIKLTAPISLFQEHLMPFLLQFALRYPELQFDIESVQREVDVIAEGIDVALRIRSTPLETGHLIAYPLKKWHLALYAAPSFLEKSRPLTCFEDFSAHSPTCMVMNASQTQWVLTHVQAPHQVHQIPFTPSHAWGSMHALTQATLAGLGVGCLMENDGQRYQETGQLTRLLPEWHTLPDQLYALTSSRAQSQRVRRLIEELKTFFKTP